MNTTEINMEKMKQDERYYIAVCIIMFPLIYLFMTWTRLFKEPFFVSILSTTCALFVLLYLINKSKTGIFFSTEGCRYKVADTDVFLKWKDIDVKIKSKHPFYRAFMINLKDQSYSFYLDPITRDSFFELIKTYAPTDHKIRAIELQYKKDFKIKN